MRLGSNNVWSKLNGICKEKKLAPRTILKGKINTKDQQMNTFSKNNSTKHIQD
jgi:hypothetical protein